MIEKTFKIRIAAKEEEKCIELSEYTVRELLTEKSHYRMDDIMLEVEEIKEEVKAKCKCYRPSSINADGKGLCQNCMGVIESQNNIDKLDLQYSIVTDDVACKLNELIQLLKEKGVV